MEGLSPGSPVSALPGIGKTREAAFARIGIFTVRDLLYHFPTAYENRGDIRRLADVMADRETHAFLLTVDTPPKSVTIRRGMTLTKFRAFDESGKIEIVFFNQPYSDKVFHVGERYRFFGKFFSSGKKLQLSNPAYEPAPEGVVLPDFVPRYGLSEGLTHKAVRRALDAALPLLSELPDPLPEELRLSHGFPTVAEALRTLHEPGNAHGNATALRRVVYDELLIFSLATALSDIRRREQNAPPCVRQNVSPLLSLLPYELTDSQKNAVREIAADMRGDGTRAAPMARVLVGDVGCGKTVCAAIALFIAFLNQRQGALLAPTEILARQHYEDLSPLFEKLGMKTGLLVGSTPRSEKKRLREALASNDPNERCDVIIGTHALLEENVTFSRLGLAVTDEQHRFGVAQRAALKEKNETAHLLVMSATPIPRTLALALYGDLAVSRITEMPRGRQRVETHLIGNAMRGRLHSFIRQMTEEGGQVYVVCPSIEEQDADGTVPLAAFSSERAEKSPRRLTAPLKSAVACAEELSDALPGISVACLHGRMKPAEKEEIMRRFSAGEISVLVSTTVIEVGVNVPNATLMVIENAERFGLSQLHQLRGRVGRGSKKSYCILVSDATGETARERLRTLCATCDGYEIAERDLALRGPGDFLASATGGSLRQSGGMELPLLGLCRDPALMESAFSDARRLLAKDPDLSWPAHRALAGEIRRRFAVNENTLS